MPENPAAEQVPITAKNPFVLRVNLGQNVPDAEARAALASGEMGFLHSFTTGSTVDGPGSSCRRLDRGLSISLSLLSQP